MTLEIQYPISREEHRLADTVLSADAGRWFALGAPERLDAVGQRLLEIAESCRDSDRHQALCSGIFRTAMFGAARPRYTRKKDKWEEAAKSNDAEKLAGQLQATGLQFLDPVSRRQTTEYIATTFGEIAALKKRRKS